LPRGTLAGMKMNVDYSGTSAGGFASNCVNPPSIAGGGAYYITPLYVAQFEGETNTQAASGAAIKITSMNLISPVPELEE
jgi:hypothetical protein